MIRQAGIRSLGAVGTSADLPMLEHIAKTDTVTIEVRKGHRDFPARNEANAAMAKIRARVG
jgi:hypothetical protein